MEKTTVQKIAEATGLPHDLISQEIVRLLEKKGLSVETAAIDDLRLVFSEYLREVILAAKDEFAEGVTIEEEITPEELGD
jgi:pantothenate kinase-related protein Tda10